MPTNYPGTEVGVNDDRSDLILPIPVDNDPGNASTFNTTFQPLIDQLQRIRKKAGFLNLASSWTAIQTFVGGFAANSSITADFQGTEAAPGFFYKLATAARSLGMKLTLTSGMACRFITTSTNSVIITINAAWDGSGWVADTPNVASLWFQLSSSGLTVKTYTAPNTTPFADGAFTTGVFIPGSGTKGQVLGFTADNVATMSNTVRYAELLMGWSGIFASNLGTDSWLYRDITGYAGLLGTVSLAAGSLTSASPTALYQVSQLPVSGPTNIYLALYNQSFPVVIQEGTSFYVALMVVFASGNISVRGINPTSEAVLVHLGGTRWRTAT